MRTIKFRGKSTESESHEWVYGFYREYLIYKSCGKCIDHISHFINLINGDSKFVDPKTVGQFTGLTDMDNKEIYEGDIVDYSVDGSKPGLIIYDDFGCVSIDYGNDRYVQTINQSLLNITEVIGNIHDNPEFKTEEL